MARLAQGYKVGAVMRSSLRERQLVMYLLSLRIYTLLEAELTQRVRSGIAVTDAFPSPPISTAYSRVPVVLLVAFVFFFLVLLAETLPVFHKFWTSLFRTRVFGFSWQ